MALYGNKCFIKPSLKFEFERHITPAMTGHKDFKRRLIVASDPLASKTGQSTYLNVSLRFIEEPHFKFTKGQDCKKRCGVFNWFHQNYFRRNYISLLLKNSGIIQNQFQRLFVTFFLAFEAKYVCQHRSLWLLTLPNSKEKGCEVYVQ